MLADEEKGLSDHVAAALNRFSKMYSMQCIRHFKSCNLSEFPRTVNEVCSENQLNLIMVPYIDFDFEEFSWRSAESSLLELFDTSFSDVCLFINGTIFPASRMNILMIFEEGNPSSRLALKFVFKLLKLPAVTVTLLHKTHSSMTEEVKTLESSNRHSFTKLQESRTFLSPNLPSRKSLTKIETDTENNSNNNVDASKELAAIEEIEKLLLQNCADSELLTKFQQLSAQNEFLQYYPFAETSLNVDFYEHHIYSFTIVVSGRSTVKSEDNRETLQELVGKTACDLLNSRVGCAQLVFSAKNEETDHIDRSNIFSTVEASVQEKVLGSKKKPNAEHEIESKKSHTKLRDSDKKSNSNAKSNFEQNEEVPSSILNENIQSNKTPTLVRVESDSPQLVINAANVEDQSSSS